MRIPFDLNNSSLENARVKYTFTSPELNQNIEISLDGEDTSVEVLLDAFHRFLNALGINTPENVVLGFIESIDEDDLDILDDDGDDEDEDDSPPNPKNKKK